MKRLLMVAVALTALLGPQTSHAYSWPGNKWPQGNPTVVSVTVGSSLPSAWAYYMGKAMASWSNAGAKFRFETSVDGRHKINLKSLPAYPFALAITYIYEGTGSRTTTDRDIDINAKYSWDINGDPNKYDAWSVVTHELGHWLTLMDLYGDNDYPKTMYGAGSPGATYQRTLHSDDIAGIKAIYGVR